MAEVNFSELQKVYLFTKDNWKRPIGLITATIIETVVVFYLLSVVLKDSPHIFIANHIWDIKITVAIFIFLMLLGWWLKSRKYPKRKFDKVGILVALREDDKETINIKNEVIQRLNETIKETDSNDILQIFTLDNFRAVKVTDPTEAEKVSNKTGAQFVIYGRLAKLGNSYEWRLQFLVRHRPLEVAGKRLMQQGFTEALVDKKWRFLESEGFNAIELTVNNIREISLYIIGIASHQSYDFDIALKLHTDLQNIFQHNHQIRAQLNPISNNLPFWISSSYVAKSMIAYANLNDLTSAVEFNKKALETQPENNNAVLNQALFEFEMGNINEAKRQIKILKHRHSREPIQDNAWRYSEAFLHFYDKKYEQGLRSYKKAFNGRVSQFSYGSVIDYLIKYIKENPEQIQFRFALSHILINKSENYPLVLEHLEEFISQAHGKAEYSSLYPIAAQYLQDSYNLMKTPESERLNLT